MAPNNRGGGARTLLVGSIPLQSAEEVFRVVARELGDLTAAIPDGETGIRKNWVAWQGPVLEAAPFLERVERSGGPSYGGQQRMAFRYRETGQPARFGALGYAREALSSYRTFAQLKTAGVIPAATRFQVSLPTPFAVTAPRIEPASSERVESLYEARIREEIDEITERIPRDQLAIQWDTAIEFAVLERAIPHPLAGNAQAILDRLVRLTKYVPDEIPMGFHFCYGDSGHKHFKEPDDTALLVETANTLAARAARPLDWLHLPVPRNRSDASYFSPLQGLKLHPRTRFYLGLVHFTDGIEGARRRIEAAKQSAPLFGIATECGMGRRPPETIGPLLALHAQIVAQHLSS